MLQRKLFTFECFFGIYFLLQSLFATHFTLPSTIGGFILLSIAQYYFAGFRVAYLIPLIIQVILLLSSSPIVHLPLYVLMYIGIAYFPIYKCPTPTGKYRVGYKNFNYEGITSIGVYYPTKEVTKDVKYTPSHNAWERFADIVRFYAEAFKRRPMPKFLFKFALNFLEHQKLGVNGNAAIIKAENATKKFPTVVFSHGLSANIHLYSVQFKEWASHGFVVFSVDHDEQIHLDVSKIGCIEDYFKMRSYNLIARKKTVAKVLDLVCDPSRVQSLFNDKDVALNYDKLFGAGHSFGAATLSELAVEDNRITGGLVLLDPWYESNNLETLGVPINKPILSVRSAEYDESPRYKKLILDHVKANEKKKEMTISGIIKGALHNSSTDLPFLMPRELVLFGMVEKIDEIENQVVSQAVLGRVFLETALEYDETMAEENNYMETLKSIVLAKFKSNLQKIGKEDIFLVDGEKKIKSFSEL